MLFLSLTQAKKGALMSVSFEDRIQYIVELRDEELLDEDYKEEDYTPDLEDWEDFNTEY